MADLGMDQLDDPAIVLLRHYRLLLSLHPGFSPTLSYTATRDAYPDYMQIVRGRARAVGNSPTVVVGDVFVRRHELILVGLHSHIQRGISTGYLHGRVVATCVVARYIGLHNYIVGNTIRYGGEGGHIAEAYRQDVRVLADQDVTHGNDALMQSTIDDVPVRFVSYPFAGGAEEYTYLSTFRVMDYYWQVTPEGFSVCEFILAQWQE